MGLREIVTWYQKKIGTYDKQQWERTIEQRILHGLTHVPKKTAKLKTELIDVDLVRGSSFPKAKPKHGLLTVTRLAALRLFMLPAYSRWWIQQTSPRVFALLLLLYVMQLINMALYYLYCTVQNEDDSSEQHVSASEVLVPGAMMMVLSMIHSQIVSTHTGPSGEPSGHKSRRMKRTKRRVLLPSRSRTVCSDSKSSPDTGSEKAGSVGESGSKYSKRVQLRRPSSSEIVRRRSVAWDTSGKGKSEHEKDKSGKSDAQGAKLGSANSANNFHKQRVRLQVEPIDGEARDRRETTPLDDDGFESLNGNGSSENGEEAAEDVEETGTEKDTQNGQGQNRSSLNWKTAPVQDGSSFSVGNDAQIERNRSALNFNAQKSEEQSQDLLLMSLNSGVPLVQITQHKDIFRLPDNKDLVLDLNSPSESLKNDVSSEEKITQCKVLENSGDDNTQNLSESSHDCINEGSQEKRLVNEKDHSRLNSPVDQERLIVRRSGSQNLQLSCGQPQRGRLAESSYNSSCESEDGGVLSSPGTGQLLTEGTTSAGEWIGITTNSEECSYSSEIEESDSQHEYNVRDNVELNDHPFAWEFELSPTVILSPSCAASDRVSCTVWESRDVKKADLSVLDISSAIIARVESMPENMDYFYVGVIMAVIISLLPSLCRLSYMMNEVAPAAESAVPAAVSVTVVELTGSLISNLSESILFLVDAALGNTGCIGYGFYVLILDFLNRERTLVLISLFERCMLSTLFFFLLAVAERTFKQRFLYAKLFSHLTSFRRARKSELPHFRLNKVRNIKTWLSVRSYLKKRGPQRSVDVIVSAAFLITLLLLSFLSVECLKVSAENSLPDVGVELARTRSSNFDSVRLHSEYNLEALVWCLVLGIFLLRFMTLGTKINRKYRNLSVLITEQELESPFKISGLSANPYLYTITKVVILSALSGVLSEMLGFKLKLHKIKIK
ncbi:hypothetical protein C0J52_15398 [Blattella germanica]|nr:hypothetical protein C0J52_15398 [Blattella germanica]